MTQIREDVTGTLLQLETLIEGVRKSEDTKAADPANADLIEANKIFMKSDAVSLFEESGELLKMTDDMERFLFLKSAIGKLQTDMPDELWCDLASDISDLMALLNDELEEKLSGEVVEGTDRARHGTVVMTRSWGFEGKP